ncbi:MAG: RecQ family ATP-dependent DNA helicase [Candidatus Aureabacteria bacterium]|nr:RecQ family ATP-dependent DNA helicase [Candidatus Auribacterota bacterium]
MSPSFSLKEAIHQKLKQYFGYDSFRPGQYSVIENLLSGKSVLAVMPTGGGKSICYQLPALMLEGVTIVVSPLISLMKDQVDKLTLKNIPVALINSTVTQREVQDTLVKAARNEIKLLYIAPERFHSGLFRDALARIRVSLFAVDEAHCISQWGHDFRPSYLRLKHAISLCGHPVIGGFTATATPKVRKDILDQLGMNNPSVIISGFDRPNLKYLTLFLKERDKKQETLDIIRQVKGPTIIYCSTQKTTAEVSSHLQVNGITCAPYHAGLDTKTRTEVQNRFINGLVQVIVATNAFGMGIDKPDIRLIIHYNMPGSIEAYYQESGRAGRDGNVSYCLLMSNRHDIRIQEYLINSSSPTEQAIKEVYEKIFDYPENPVLRTYREIAGDCSGSVSEMMIGNVLKILESYQLVKRMQESQHPAYVILSLSYERLLQRNQTSASKKRILHYLQETYPQPLLGSLLPFSVDQSLNKTGLSRDQFYRHIHQLSDSEGFTYIPPFSGKGIQKITARMNANSLPIDFKKIEEARANQLLKVGQIHEYMLSRECRRNYLLGYFGEQFQYHRCGGCDICLNWRSQSRYKKRETPSVTAPVSAKTREENLVNGDIKTVYECIRKYNNKLGVHRIVELLKGSKNAELIRLGLHKCSFYAKLHKNRTANLVDLIKKDIRSGYLKKTRGKFPKLGLTDEGRIKFNSFHFS